MFVKTNIGNLQYCIIALCHHMEPTAQRQSAVGHYTVMSCGAIC